MNTTNRQKEQYNILKQQAKEYKKSIYQDYPQVKKYEKIKGIMIKYLLILLVLITVLRVYNVYSVTGNNLFMLVISSLIRIDWIFLLAALTPRWQLSLLLYLLLLDKASEFFTSLSGVGIASFDAFMQFYTMAFQQYPLAAIADVLTILYLISILVVAVWLTLLPQNRELAKQSEELIIKVKNFVSTKSSV